MIITLIIVGLTGLFSRRRKAEGADRPAFSISKSTRRYLCGMGAFTMMVAYGVFFNIMAVL